MRGRAARTLVAIALGLVAAGATFGTALAETDKEYRIIGCDGPPFPGNPGDPPPPPSFTVVFSSVPGDVGLPCEDVLTSLGAQGFRLVDSREGAIPFVGLLHYLERRIKK